MSCPLDLSQEDTNVSVQKVKVKVEIKTPSESSVESSTQSRNDTATSSNSRYLSQEDVDVTMHPVKVETANESSTESATVQLRENMESSITSVDLSQEDVVGNMQTIKADSESISSFNSPTAQIRTTDRGPFEKMTDDFNQQHHHQQQHHNRRSYPMQPSMDWPPNQAVSRMDPSGSSRSLPAVSDVSFLDPPAAHDGVARQVHLPMNPTVDVPGCARIASDDVYQTAINLSPGVALKMLSEIKKTMAKYSSETFTSTPAVSRKRKRGERRDEEVGGQVGEEAGMPGPRQRPK